MWWSLAYILERCIRLTTIQTLIALFSLQSSPGIAFFCLFGGFNSIHLLVVGAFIAYTILQREFYRFCGHRCMVLTEEAFNWLVSLGLEELFTLLLWIPVIIRARVFDRKWIIKNSVTTWIPPFTTDEFVHGVILAPQQALGPVPSAGMQMCVLLCGFFFLQSDQNFLTISLTSLHWSEMVVTAASGSIQEVINGAKLHGSALPSDYGRVKGQPFPSTSSIRKRALKRAYKRRAMDTHGTRDNFGPTLDLVSHWNSMLMISLHLHLSMSNQWFNLVNIFPGDDSKFYIGTHLVQNIKSCCTGASPTGLTLQFLLHWHFDEEWLTDHYHAIHSGPTTPSTFDRSSGILVAISKKLFAAYQIAWTSIQPGRLLHCRIHCHPRPLDLVGIYQYVWNGNVLQTQRRQQLWDLTYQTIDALAKRNTLCFLGDFNCSLDMIPTLVGTDHYVGQAGVKMRGPQHGDKQQLKKLIQDLNLVGLNTWNSSQGPTFINTLGRSSKIDFLFTRMFHADGHAKKVGYPTEAPFLQGGPQHIPLLANLGQYISRASRSSTSMFSSDLKTRCINDFRAESPAWQGCMNDINEELRQTTVHSLEQLTDIMNQGVLTKYSKHRAAPKPQVPGSLQQQWRHFSHQWRKQQGAGTLLKLGLALNSLFPVLVCLLLWKSLSVPLRIFLGQRQWHLSMHRAFFGRVKLFT